MSDLTAPFNKCLSRYHISISSCSVHQGSLQDEFLKESYRIYKHILSLRQYLLSIRRAYNSTAPPSKRPRRNLQYSDPVTSAEPTYLSNQEKDSLDSSSKSVLRDLTASITQLASAESVRRETSAHLLNKKYNKNFLNRWAGGDTATGKDAAREREEDALETVKLVRDSILWFLQKRLEVVSEIQRRMMERRLDRDIEKGRSMLHRVRKVNGRDTIKDSTLGAGTTSEGLQQGSLGTSAVDLKGQHRSVEIEEERRKEIEKQLDPDQLQLFAKENKDMLKFYEDTLDQVRTAERSMLEISELQTQLVQNLDIQSSNISQLVADSFSTTENVGSGNKQLKRASERSSKARMVFWASIGLTGFLVTWDLIF